MTNENFKVFGSEENVEQDVFYRQFKGRLNEGMAFPSPYIYKFIIPASPAKMAHLHAVFENVDAAFSTKESSKGKYTSVTVSIKAKDADEVIRYYQEVAALKEVVML